MATADALDSLKAEVRWCIDRCLDPMIKNRLQAALDAYLDAPAVRPMEPAGFASPSSKMRVCDLVFLAGTSHAEALIKLNIHGSKNTAYATLPRKYSVVNRTDQGLDRIVVLDVHLDHYDLRLKPGKRTW